MLEVIHLRGTAKTQITDIKSRTTQELSKESTICKDQLYHTALLRTMELISLVEPLEVS